MPATTAFEFRFDRYLLPNTAVRQSILLFTGDRGQSVWLLPHHDVVERVVRYAPEEGRILRSGVRYSVELALVDENELGNGFLAFDRARLSRQGSAPIEFSFRTQEQEHPPARVNAPIPTCQEALAVFTRGGCASAACHGASDVTSVALDLASAESVLRTAIGRVARQTETEGQSGVALENPARFGVGMPLIERGRPDNSYLFYKMLIQGASYGPDPCSGSVHEVPLGGQCIRPSPEETSRLRDWFVRGEPMPPGKSSPLLADDLRTLQLWIAGGAETVDCDGF